MRRLRFTQCGVSAIALLALGLYSYFIYAPNPDRPTLGGELQYQQLDVEGRQRAYQLYIPATHKSNPEFLLVMHASNQTAEGVRISSAYEFERLAELNGFIVAYPEGIDRSWNDCRRSASYAARKQNIDDIKFIQALIKQTEKQQDINPSRVFLAGYSNGAHLGYRIALEKPHLLRGIAAVAASLPTAENSDCLATGEAISVMVMNGTADPINPYNGGEVALFGLGSRGDVLSSRQTAEYFAGLADAHPLPSTKVPEAPEVTIDRWYSGKAEVSLYSLKNGGHVIPQPFYRGPRFLGKTLTEFNGPQAIWAFFARRP